MDMTGGPLLTNVLLFSWPLILTGILQLLFNAADMMVVGRYSGAQAPQALAAVGSTGSLINLLINVFLGLSVGASVLVAQRWGANDQAAVGRAVHTAITVAFYSSLLVGAVGVIFAKPLLRMMNNPDDGIYLFDAFGTLVQRIPLQVERIVGYAKGRIAYRVQGSIGEYDHLVFEDSRRPLPIADCFDVKWHAAKLYYLDRNHRLTIVE